jgi:hypothetical protein
MPDATKFLQSFTGLGVDPPEDSRTWLDLGPLALLTRNAPTFGEKVL